MFRRVYAKSDGSTSVGFVRVTFNMSVVFKIFNSMDILSHLGTIKFDGILVIFIPTMIPTKILKISLQKLVPVQFINAT